MQCHTKGKVVINVYLKEYFCNTIVNMVPQHAVS